MSISRSLIFAVIAFLVFFAMSFFRQEKSPSPSSAVEFVKDRIVIPAALLATFHGGDKYLAANLETIRLAATGIDERGSDTQYLIRAHREVARLNPCHEDNYYLANGLLTWGGAVEAGNDVLEAAIKCRTWDFMPPFFYGINLAFFGKQNEKAAEMLEIGAERSPENRAALLKTATMLRAETLANETLALNYLRHQRDSSSDSKLKEMLNKRVVRLEGLLALRDAQKEYQTNFGELQTLEHLVEKGFIEALPEDPLRLGYELKNGQIELKKLRIAGMEN